MISSLKIVLLAGRHMGLFIQPLKKPPEPAIIQH